MEIEDCEWYSRMQKGQVDFINDLLSSHSLKKKKVLERKIKVVWRALYQPVYCVSLVLVLALLPKIYFNSGQTVLFHCHVLFDL